MPQKRWYRRQVRVALYGGSFNPPHLSHQLACAVALATARPAVDEVWMVPTFEHSFGKQLEPFEDRHAMCLRASRIFGERVKVSRIEETLGGSSYTVRTVEALHAQHPEHELTLLIGADLVDERPRWHRWAELEPMVSFLVVGRHGTSLSPLGPRDHQVPIDLPEVSSTEVRRRLVTGESTVGMLDDEVARYIREHGLYGARR